MNDKEVTIDREQLQQLIHAISEAGRAARQIAKVCDATTHRIQELIRLADQPRLFDANVG